MKQDPQSEEILSFVQKEKATNQQNKAKTRELIQYLTCMGIQTVEQMKLVTKKCLQMLKEPVHYDPTSHFEPDIHIRATRFTKQQEFIDVQVKIGHFILTRICIINISTKSPTHLDNHTIGMGVFGQIYQCRCEGKQLAMKCFKRQPYCALRRKTLKWPYPSIACCQWLRSCGQNRICAISSATILWSTRNAQRLLWSSVKNWVTASLLT